MKFPYTLSFFLCLGGILTAQEVYFPDRYPQWETRQASEYSISEQALTQAVSFAVENEYSGPRDLRRAILKGFEREPYHKITGPTKKRGGPAGMVLKNGYLIKQWGDITRVDMTFSVTKSFLSTTTALAWDKGLISDLQDMAGEYVWDGTFEGDHNSKINWEHLLHQTSDWSGNLWGGLDWADRPPREGGIDDWKNRTLQEPGTVMEYNDVRVNVLAYAMTHVWRKPLPEVLKTHIMDPIGASTTWRWFGYENAWTVIDGIQMKSVTGGGHSGGGMFINTMDMARFGLLFMADGKWKNEQLISQTWIDKATTPSVPNPNYGYMWWLNEEGNRHWDNLPDTLFYAAGFGGNFIVVDQEKNLVIVTRWLEPSKLEEFLNLVYRSLP